MRPTKNIFCEVCNGLDPIPCSSTPSEMVTYSYRQYFSMYDLLVGNTARLQEAEDDEERCTSNHIWDKYMVSVDYFNINMF